MPVRCELGGTRCCVSLIFAQRWAFCHPGRLGLAAERLDFAPSLPPMNSVRAPCEGDMETSERHCAFKVAVSALYLNRFHWMNSDVDDREKENQDFQGFCRLRDAVDGPGIVADEIEPPFETKETFGERETRLLELLVSDHPAARMTLGDFPFSDVELRRLANASNGRDREIDFSEVPIARWFPSSIIWEFRAIVCEHFEGRGDTGNLGGFLSALVAERANSDQQSSTPTYPELDWESIASQCPEWSSRRAKNVSFVRMAVTMVMDGRQPNARAATLALVDQHGWAPQGQATNGMIVSASPDIASELAKRANKILNFLYEKGHLPETS